MDTNELTRVFRSMAELKRRKEYRMANKVFIELLEILMATPYAYPLGSIMVLYETDVERNAKKVVVQGELPCKKNYMRDLVIMQWEARGHVIEEGIPVRCLPRKLRRRVPVFIKAIRGRTVGRYLHNRVHEPRWAGSADDLLSQAVAVLHSHQVSCGRS